MQIKWFKASALGALVLATAVACDDSPIDEGLDEVTAISFDKSYLSINPGGSVEIKATPVNQYGSPIRSDVEFTACENNLVTVGDVVADSAALTAAVIADIEAGNTLGYSCVVATAGGVTDTLNLVVTLPYLAATATEGLAGDTVVLLRSVGQPPFDADVTVMATAAEGPPLEHKAYWLRLSSNEDSLHVVLPISLPVGPYTLSVENIGPAQSAISADFDITGVAEWTDTITDYNEDPAGWALFDGTFEHVGIIGGGDGGDVILWNSGDPAGRCTLDYDIAETPTDFVTWLYSGEDVAATSSAITGGDDGTYHGALYNWSTGFWTFNFTTANPSWGPTFGFEVDSYHPGDATSYHLRCIPE